MIDYSKGKIYAIRSHLTDKIYIGSTTQILCKRLSGHIRDFNYKQNVSSKLILEKPDYYIELIENYPCNSKEELFRKEGEIIRKYKDKCVNVLIAGRTRDEWYNENKTILSDKRKIYRKNNKDIISEKKKKYYNDNLEKHSENMKVYRELNKEELKIKKKNYATIKITCDCGAVITKGCLNKHLKRSTHKRNITEI